VGNSAITKLGGCGAYALSVGVGKLVDGSYMGAAERWKLVPISELRRLMRSCLSSRALAAWTWPEGPTACAQTVLLFTKHLNPENL